MLVYHRVYIHNIYIYMFYPLWSPSPGYAPRGKTFRRELLVDDEEGAGLELETVPCNDARDWFLDFPWKAVKAEPVFGD